MLDSVDFSNAVNVALIVKAALQLRKALQASTKSSRLSGNVQCSMRQSECTTKVQASHQTHICGEGLDFRSNFFANLALSRGDAFVMTHIPW